VADKKSAKYPHKWPDGTWHSIPWTETKRAQAGAVVAPPPGSYDPNLDSQLGVSQRQLSDLIASIGEGGTQRVRGEGDYLSTLAEMQQGRDRARADYNTGVGDVDTGYKRNLSDLLQSREQGQQDYNTNVGTLQRNFQQLGTAQGEAQRKAGAMAGSGAELQAARKRTANEAIERSPLDTALSRFLSASQTSEGRLNEDRTSTLDRLKLAYDRGEQDFGANQLKLGTGYQRQGEDWTTQLELAKREAGAFGDDTLQAKIAQFTQNFPGQKLPILYPGQTGAVPAAQGVKWVTAGPGVPGTVTTTKKRKGKTISTYMNALSGP
jgi:hypothetical protein